MQGKFIKPLLIRYVVTLFDFSTPMRLFILSKIIKSIIGTILYLMNKSSDAPFYIAFSFFAENAHVDQQQADREGDADGIRDRRSDLQSFPG